MTSEMKRQLGSFYTSGNPFLHVAFSKWFNQIPDVGIILEPFAGSGAIPELMHEAGYNYQWRLYDIDQALSGVIHMDTLKEFPKEFRITITNPPYLSYHFAKRKKINIEKSDFQGFSSLYFVAIKESLDNCEYVGMIIPESFITSGLFQERLQTVISLPYPMFNDTEMPTCLALWGPKPTDINFEIWVADEFIGHYSDLAGQIQATPCAGRIQFNRLDGQIGLKAIDNTAGPSIYFCDSEAIPENKIKQSARLVSRIFIDGLEGPEDFIVLANRICTDWRLTTNDIELTAFKGYRKDGKFRRRLDFSNARKILSNALCEHENHRHEIVNQMSLDSILP